MEDVCHLAGGEEAFIECFGILTLDIVDGAIDVDGLPLTESHIELGSSRSPTTHIVLFSWSGATVRCRGQSTKIVKSKSSVPQLVECVRQLNSKSVVLVIGPRGCGKSRAAKTVVNSLVKRRVNSVLVDLDGENGFVAPNTIASVEVTEGILPHTEFGGVPIVYFASSNKSKGLYLHTVSQLLACASWQASQEGSHAIVVDLPYLGGETHRRVVDLVQPTSVLALGSDPQTDDFQSHVARMGTNCTITNLPALHQSDNVSTHRAECLQHYFLGGSRSLGTRAVAVALSQIHLVEIALNAGQLQVQDIELHKTLLHCVAAVSHASQREEVPFANIAGLCIIVGFSKEDDELHIMIPTGECFVPRPFLIVDSSLSALPGAFMAHTK